MKDKSRSRRGVRISFAMEASSSFVGVFAAGMPESQRRRELPARPPRCLSREGSSVKRRFTESEWRALTDVAQHPEWATDIRFKDLAARLRHQDALDALVGQWTTSQDASGAMLALQRAGVPAGVCQTAEDRCDRDPQLAALEWLTEVTGTKIGRWPIAEVPVKMTESPAYIGGRIDRGAPCYGEDNEYVYGELLGMSSGEIKSLADEGVI